MVYINRINNESENEDDSDLIETLYKECMASSRPQIFVAALIDQMLKKVSMKALETYCINNNTTNLDEALQNTECHVLKEISHMVLRIADCIGNTKGFNPTHELEKETVLLRARYAEQIEDIVQNQGGEL